jgi:hypothetical protein
VDDDDDDDNDADPDADADANAEDIFGGANDNHFEGTDHGKKKRRGPGKGPKRTSLVDEKLDKEASTNSKTRLYEAVYDSFMSEKEPLTTSTDVDQTVETVEEICTSLLTEEKELTLVKLGKANMVS